MAVYIVFILLSLLLYLVSRRFAVSVQRQNRFTVWLSFFFLLLLLALRHPSMGADLNNEAGTGYLASFQKLADFSWRQVLSLPSFLNYDRGYVLFNKFVGMFGSSQQWFLAVCALVSLLPVAIVTARESEMPFLSVVIYLGLPIFLVLFSALRQGIAIGLCMAAWMFLKKKRPIPFLLFVFMAGMFHFTAFIFVVAWPIRYIRVGKTGRLLSLLFLAVFYFVQEPLFEFLISFVPRSYELDYNGDIGLLFLYVAIYVFCSFFAEADEQGNFLLNLLWVACILQCFGSLMTVAARMAYYFEWVLVLLVPHTIAAMKNDRDRLIARVGASFGFAGFSLYCIYYTSWSMSYPYYFFWELV